MIAAATPLLVALAAAAPPQPVQLCGCDEAARGAQTWLWGNRTAGGVTAPTPLRLRGDPSRCLYAGQVAGRSQPHALYVDDCARATPPNFSFVPSMRPQDTRDTSVLRAADPTLAHMCADAAGMTAEMQLCACSNGRLGLWLLPTLTADRCCKQTPASTTTTTSSTRPSTATA